MSPKNPAKKTQQKTKQAPQFDTSKIAYTALAVSAFILYYYSKSFDFIQDDAFITFRYVKNFAEGDGLVFNIGDKVEGYTCFLWVMLLSLVKKLGFNFISASQTLGIISSVFTLLFTYRVSEKVFPKDKDTFYNLAFSLIAVILV